MMRGVLFGPMQTAEASRGVESQNSSAVQHQIPVIVRLGQRAAADQAQAAGHPEMQDQGAALQTNENVFGASIDAQDFLIAHGRFEIGRDRPTQAPISDDHIEDAMADERWRNAASRGFYFGKLRQRRWLLKRTICSSILFK